VTHPRIYAPPTPTAQAVDQIAAWLEAPNLVLLAETGRHWQHLRTLVEAGQIAGAQVHDARIATLCLQHDVEALWTADRDFTRFPALAVRNPLVR
jgi:hypothetical protein